MHLAYAADDFHCLLDGDLFLPESWSDDRERCREAGIPEDMTYRPKTEIALELYDRAVGNGVRFAWLTFDEWYGGKPEFLRELDGRKQPFVGEVPKTFMGWIDPPRVTERPFRRGRGRGRKAPRIVAGSRPAAERRIPVLVASGAEGTDWQRWRVKDGEKGPMVWEVKHVPFYPQGPDGLPRAAGTWWSPATCSIPRRLKFFVSNAPPETGAGTILSGRLFPLARGTVLRGRQRGSRPGSLRRTALSGTETALDPQCDQLLVPGADETTVAGKKIRVDRVPNPHGRVGADPLVVALQPRLGQAARTHRRDDSQPTAKKRPRPPKPQQANSPRITPIKHPSYSNPSL